MKQNESDLAERLAPFSPCPEAESRHILNFLSAQTMGEIQPSFDEMLDEILEKRSKNMPLQYILKFWQFRKLELYLDSRVLIPRAETELAVDIILDLLKGLKGRESCRVLDLGCGSGAVGLSVALEILNSLEPSELEVLELEVLLTDISPGALEVAKINSANLPKRLLKAGRSKVVRFQESDWFSNIDLSNIDLSNIDLGNNKRSNKLFDLIFSNPPYVSETEELPAEIENFEPRIALRAGKTGFEALERIITEAGGWLAPKAWLVLELAPHQAEQAFSLASSCGYENISIHKDLNQRDRFLIAQNL